jgi:hypothetical protein
VTAARIGAALAILAEEIHATVRPDETAGTVGQFAGTPDRLLEPVEQGIEPHKMLETHDTQTKTSSEKMETEMKPAPA